MIIALGHKAHQGKDSAALALNDYYNGQRDKQFQHGLFPATPEIRTFRFAGALYEVCQREYGMTTKDAPLLQNVGDGRRKEFGEDYWIKILESKMSTFKGIVVIPDMRYLNEAQWIKSLGGFTINVQRLNQHGTPFIADDRDPNFISEVQLDNYNYDAYIKSKSPVLTGELAISTVEYFRGLNR